MICRMGFQDIWRKRLEGSVIAKPAFIPIWQEQKLALAQLTGGRVRGALLSRAGLLGEIEVFERFGGLAHRFV